MADQEWVLLRTPVCDPVRTMAIDDYLLQYPRNIGIVRIYQWTSPTLSVAKGQALSTINMEYCKSKGILVVRRPTGGEAALHWPYDITYSIAVPAAYYSLPGDEQDERMKNEIVRTKRCLKRMRTDIRQRVATGLNQFGVESIVNDENSIIVNDRKISGNAQGQLNNSRLLLHGFVGNRRTPGQREQMIEYYAGCVTPDYQSAQEMTEKMRSAIITFDELRPDVKRGMLQKAIEDALLEGRNYKELSMTQDDMRHIDELLAKYEKEKWLESGKNPKPDPCGILYSRIALST